jgi:hypothetical protein
MKVMATGVLHCLVPDLDHERRMTVNLYQIKCTRGARRPKPNL